MLQWFIRFLQGPSATQYEPSPLHQYLMELEYNREVFESRALAQQEGQRVQRVRDGRLIN